MIVAWLIGMLAAVLTAPPPGPRVRTTPAELAVITERALKERVAAARREWRWHVAAWLTGIALYGLVAWSVLR